MNKNSLTQTLEIIGYEEDERDKNSGKGKLPVRTHNLIDEIQALKSILNSPLIVK